MNIHQHFGLAGVTRDERKIARRACYFFDLALIPVIFVLAALWDLEIEGLVTSRIVLLADMCVLAFFIIRNVTLTALVRDRTHFLKTNWLFIFIMILWIPLAFSIHPLSGIVSKLRLLVIILLCLPFMGNIIRSLSDGRLLTTIIAAMFIITLTGIIMAGIDPGIPTPWDGVWFAWVSAFHVGYGDFVPVSPLGRLFGSLIIVMGLGLFAIFTANFSAIFVRRDVREQVKQVQKESEDIKVVLRELKEVKKEEDDIISVLNAIQKRLDSLEKKDK